MSDQAVREFYGTTFDFTATQTDGSGLGGFVNVPPGAVTVTATPIALGKPSSKRTVLVRAGTFTGFYLLPNL